MTVSKAIAVGTGGYYTEVLPVAVARRQLYFERKHVYSELYLAGVKRKKCA